MNTTARDRYILEEIKSVQLLAKDTKCSPMVLYCLNMAMQELISGNHGNNDPSDIVENNFQELR